MIIAATFYALTHHYAFRQFPSCCFIEYCFDRHKTTWWHELTSNFLPSLFSLQENVCLEVATKYKLVVRFPSLLIDRRRFSNS